MFLRMKRALIRASFFFICAQIFWNINAYGVEPSTAETDFHNEYKGFDIHNFVSLYQPNYFLAFYHTSSPDYDMYEDRTPGDVALQQNEIKLQLSFEILLLRNMGTENLRLYVAYTQLMFWQLYSRNPFIRETDYEPMIYLRYHFAKNMFANWTLDHQSNGKGGYMEVSWNRIIGALELTGKNWYTQWVVWYPFLPVKADDHNPSTLTYYLGYDKLILSYNFKDIVFSVEAQNFESGLQRGHVMASASYAASSFLKLYVQYFRGYGQSLIEFDNKTTSFGVGVAFSDWQ